MVIIVFPSGQVAAAAHAGRDAGLLAALGPVGTVRRGGHVLPAHPVRRALFRLIRRIFRRLPGIVGWTRRWRGPWIADLSPSGGPVLGPFAGREEAVRAEEEHLAALLLRGSGRGEEERQ